MVTEFKASGPWIPPDFSTGSPESYTWHYARESGKPSGSGRQQPGPRWQKKGAIPPGSTFTLSILQIRRLKQAQQDLFDAALKSFLCFGSLGLRATRGLGSFDCRQAPPWEEQSVILEKSGFLIARRFHPGTFPTWKDALRDWSSWLRDIRRTWNNDKRPSALGGGNPRHTSAVRFRPIRLPDKTFTWIALEAPHRRVYGDRIAVKNLLVDPEIFSGRAPPPPERHGR